MNLSNNEYMYLIKKGYTTSEINCMSEEQVLEEIEINKKSDEENKQIIKDYNKRLRKELAKEVF